MAIVGSKGRCLQSRGGDPALVQTRVADCRADGRGGNGCAWEGKRGAGCSGGVVGSGGVDSGDSEGELGAGGAGEHFDNGCGW